MAAVQLKLTGPSMGVCVDGHPRLAHGKHLGLYWRIQEGGVYLLSGFLPVREHRDVPLKLHSQRRAHLKLRVMPFSWPEWGAAGVAHLPRRHSEAQEREGTFWEEAAERTHRAQRWAGTRLPLRLTKGDAWGALGSEGKAAPHVLGHSQRRFLALLGHPCPRGRKINREGKAWDKRHLRQAGGSVGRLRGSRSPGPAGTPGRI